MKYYAITKTFQNIINAYIPNSVNEYEEIVFGVMKTDEILEYKDSFLDYATEGKICLMSDCLIEMTEALTVEVLMYHNPRFENLLDGLYEAEFKSDFIGELRYNDEFMKYLFNLVKDDLSGFSDD